MFAELINHRKEANMYLIEGQEISDELISKSIYTNLGIDMIQR